MPTVILQTKFYTDTQNNSGGVFDHNPERGIGYAICVEATSAAHALRRLHEITDSYPGRSGDCACCGDRWSFYLSDDDDGEEAPSLYGEPLTGGWGIKSYVHFMDGRIVDADDLTNGGQDNG